MHDDHTELLHRLQATVDHLTERVDELATRVEAQQRRDTPPPVPSSDHQRDSHSPSIAPESAHKTSEHESNLVKTPVAKLAAEPIVKPVSNLQSRPKPNHTPIKKRPAFDPSKFEWLLGIRGLMLVGVFIVVVGVGMFLKLARDEGWIAMISPSMRCASTAAFGLGLVGLGEVLRRKINPLASSGFSAAGIAAVYASILAAAKIFDLIEAPVAFTLLFIVTVMGIGLGALSNRVMLSLLSLVGAFAVPILLATGEPSRVVLPLYLLSLLTMGLVLSGWRGGHYSYVRQLAWWGTGIVGTMWLSKMYMDAPASSLAFVGAAWMMTVVELAVSARFFTTLRDERPWPETSNAGFIRMDDAEIRFNPRSLLSPESRWINALFGATVWAVIAAGLTLGGIKPEYDFIAPLAFALLSVLIVLVGSFTKLSIIGKLWDESSSPRALFGAALVINSAMLIAATIAVALGGWLQVVAWVVVGLAGIETGRRIRFRAAGIFGMVLLAFAMGRLLTIDLDNSINSTPSFDLFGISLTPWTLQMALATLASFMAYWRSRYRAEKTIAICAAFWLAGLAMIHSQTQIHSLGSAWMVISATGCWMSVWFKNNTLRTNTYFIAGVAMCIVLAAQLSELGNFVFEADIHVASMLIAALAWAAIASVPSSGFIARTLGAVLAIFSILIAIGKLNSTLGTAEMLLFQSIALGGILALGNRLYAWSLNEIASILILFLTAGWGIYEIDQWSATIQGAPFLRIDSLGALSLLFALLWSARTTMNRKQASDAPDQLSTARRSISIACYSVFWFLLLGSSTLEVVRSTHEIFDTRSARGASVSIWWSVFAIASVAGGFTLHRALRWSGLLLMGVVAVKVLLIDTMTLAPPARVVAAITVGLIIIATGVLYTRLIALTEGGPKDSSIPNPDDSS